MSHGATSVIFHHSQAKGNDLLVLMAIGNYMSDEGAWPKVETIAKYARTSERQVHRSLASLASLGEIAWIKGGGRGQGTYRPNLYSLLLSCPADCSGDWNHTKRQDVRSRGDRVSGLGMTHTADKPVSEPVKEPYLKATKINQDFTITDEMQSWLKDKGFILDIKEQTELFIGHYQATGKAMKDWTAAWRNWMIKAAKWSKPKWEQVAKEQAIESKLKLDIDKELTKQMLAEYKETSVKATPPPKCQHGNSIVSCKRCLKALN